MHPRPYPTHSHPEPALRTALETEIAKNVSSPCEDQEVGQAA